MMAAWETETPGRIDQIARALARVEPSQLADPKLFDFLGLGTSKDPVILAQAGIQTPRCG